MMLGSKCRWPCLGGWGQRCSCSESSEVGEVSQPTVFPTIEEITDSEEEVERLRSEIETCSEQTSAQAEFMTVDEYAEFMTGVYERYPSIADFSTSYSDSSPPSPPPAARCTSSSSSPSSSAPPAPRAADFDDRWSNVRTTIVENPGCYISSKELRNHRACVGGPYIPRKSIINRECRRIVQQGTRQELTRKSIVKKRSSGVLCV